jgi:hypothetical protein
MVVESIDAMRVIAFLQSCLSVISPLLPCSLLKSSGISAIIWELDASVDGFTFTS